MSKSTSLLSFAQLPFAAQIHPEARPARAITWDSRKADEQTAFVALAGENMHGNQFLAQALERGAPFVLTDQPISQVSRAVQVADAWQALQAWAQQARASNPLVVGITGSAGKTTAKAYAAAALGAHFMPVYNTMPAIACFLLEFGHSQQPLVVEMGIDRLGEMSELMDLVRPDIGVITSIGPAHLEQLGSVEQIAYEKGQILAAKQGLVSSQAAAFYSASTAQSYGFEGAQIAGQDLQLTAEGASFSFGGQAVSLSLASRVQAEAAVLGLHLAQQAQLPLLPAMQRVEKTNVPEGRYQVKRGQIILIDDSYNSSPLAVKVALDSLANFSGRKISVLGQMLELGESACQLHHEVGQHARQKSDLSYGVGQFASELGTHAYQTVPELTTALLQELQPGDVVLVKASRGLSLSTQQRAAAGVGLEVLVAALWEKWGQA